MFGKVSVVFQEYFVVFQELFVVFADMGHRFTLNAFEQKEKKRGLKYNPGLALIGLRRTGPRKLARLFLLKKIKSPFPSTFPITREIRQLISRRSRTGAAKVKIYRNLQESSSLRKSRVALD